jgi:hypothetical protein
MVIWYYRLSPMSQIYIVRNNQTRWEKYSISIWSGMFRCRKSERIPSWNIFRLSFSHNYSIFFSENDDKLLNRLYTCGLYVFQPHLNSPFTTLYKASFFNRPVTLRVFAVLEFIQASIRYRHFSFPSRGGIPCLESIDNDRVPKSPKIAYALSQ